MKPNKQLNILIIGNGGREHAFAWKIVQSPHCGHLYVAPGNAGTAKIAENVAIPVGNFTQLARFSIEKKIDLILVGPEVPLVKGIRNFFADSEKLRHIAIIGPGKEGAILEGSKNFAKAFMHKYQIPTAKHETFHKETIKQGIAYLKKQTPPFVIKADGLAAGKGVLIVDHLEEAENLFQEMLLNQKFGEASKKVIVEDFLQGIELSVFVLTDGQDYKILPEAKDYKRIGEGDTGLNTGGMGAVSPVPFADKAFLDKVAQQVIQPTIYGLQKEGLYYQGFIFFGLMKVGDDPFVIEYNVRMGDPESQVVIPRIKSDFVEMLWATAQNRLAAYELEIHSAYAATTVVVSGGYPEDYEKGKVITYTNLPQEVIPFHAGTVYQEEQVLTNGGRVMALTARGSTVSEALAKSREAAEVVQFEDKYFRTDIGLDLL